MSLTALAILGVFIGGLALAAFVHPFWALFSYLWIFYNHPEFRWWGDSAPDIRYTLIAAFVALLFSFKIHIPQSTKSSYKTGAVLLSLYALWMWVQMLWAVNPTAHMEGAILFTKYIILYLIICRIVNTERQVRGFFWVHVLGCFGFGWIAFTTMVSGRFETALGPGVGSSNIVAAHLVTALVFSGFMFLGFPKYQRWFALALIPFILNAIILTQSRGAFVTMLASGFAAIVFAPKSRRGAIILAAIMGGVLLSWLAHEHFWDRVASITQVAEGEAEETRLAIIGPQFRMFIDYPLGAGHRGNEYLSPDYMDDELLSSSGRRSAHNTFMAVLVDQGVPGVAIMLGIYLWVAIVLNRLRQVGAQEGFEGVGLYAAAIGTALFGCFISGLFLNTLKMEVQVWLIALLASLQGLSATMEKSDGSGNRKPRKRY